MHGSSRERRLAGAAVALVLVVAAALALAALRGGPTSRRGARAIDAGAEAAPRDVLETREGGRELAISAASAVDEVRGRTEVRQESPAELRSITGVALLPSGAPCAGGLALAWEDGPLPSPEAFSSARAGRGGRVVAVALGSDGSFAFTRLAAGTAHSVSAVAPGAVCTQRVTKVRAGDAPLVLRMQLTYGLALRLREVGGGALRTGPLVLGGKRRQIEDSPAALDDRRELHALRIPGLGFEPEPRYGWRHVSVADEELDSIGPLALELEVPGYEPAVARARLPRLVDGLEELVVELRPAVPAFGVLTVRIVGSPQAESLGMEPERPIGVLYLSKDGERHMQHAIHARALREHEWLAGMPAGRYSAEFEAADAYSLAAGNVEIGGGATELRVDCSDAGTLHVELAEDAGASGERFVVQVHERDTRKVFFVVFPRAPYVLPALPPGSYRVEPMELAGRQRSDLTQPEVEVHAGRTSVARVERAASATDAR